MFCYQVLAMPFKHKFMNLVCTINEGTLAMISSIQIVFITDSKDIQVIVMTGWVMVGLTTIMVISNITVVISYVIYHKIKSRKAAKASKQNNLRYEININQSHVVSRIKDTSYVSSKVTMNPTKKMKPVHTKRIDAFKVNEGEITRGIVLRKQKSLT